MQSRKFGMVVLVFIIILGLTLRAVFAFNLKSMNSDTAVFGLMAKHILEGVEFPIYMPLAHYCGSLSSYIGAVLFMMLGASSTVFNLVSLIYSSLWVILVFFLARESLDYVGTLTALLFAALPFYNILHHSFWVGTHSESFLFVPLLLLILIRWGRSAYESRYAIPALLGFLSGIGLWTSWHALPAVVTVITVILSDTRRDVSYKIVLCFFAGFLIGYAPALIYNFQYPSATFLRMAGRILDLDRSALAAPNLTGLVMSKILWRISTIPVSAWKIVPFTSQLIGIPNAALFIISVLLLLKDRVSVFRKNINGNMWRILLIYIGWFVVFYAVLVGERGVRYMTPLCLVYPLFAGYLISRLVMKFRFFGISILAALLVYNCCTVAYSVPDRNKDRYSALAQWLVAKELRYGFSDYWRAYITQFETKENSIISPTLFHPDFLDRWPSQTAQVRNAPKAFYLIDMLEYPDVALALEAKCTEQHVSFKKKNISGFSVYYDFSRKIYPEELPLRKSGKK